MAFSKRIQEAWGNRWYALPFLALMGLLSCTGEKNTDVLPTVDLTGVTNRTEIKLSDVTSDVTYVKLETNDSCLIGNNFQLYADDQYIFSFSNGQIDLPVRPERWTFCAGHLEAGRGTGRVFSDNPSVTGERT